MPPVLLLHGSADGHVPLAQAEALCEAMSRPSMRFVAPKTAEQQAALMLVSLRDRLVRSRTQLTNAPDAFGICHIHCNDFKDALVILRQML